jgi:hypothetical protein
MKYNFDIDQAYAIREWVMAEAPKALGYPVRVIREDNKLNVYLEDQDLFNKCLMSFECNPMFKDHKIPGYKAKALKTAQNILIRYKDDIERNRVKKVIKRLGL